MNWIMLLRKPNSADLLMCENPWWKLLFETVRFSLISVDLDLNRSISLLNKMN